MAGALGYVPDKAIFRRTRHYLLPIRHFFIHVLRQPKTPDPLFPEGGPPLCIAHALFFLPGPVKLAKFLGAKKVTFRKSLFLTSYKTNAVKKNRVRLLTLRVRPKITLPSHFGTLQNHAHGEKKMVWAKMKPEPSNKKPAIHFLDFKNTAFGKKKTHQGEQRPDQSEKQPKKFMVFEPK